MTTTPPLADPRPAFRTTLDWVGDLIGQVTPGQLDRPTPCSEWTVHDLLCHLLGVGYRVGVIGRGGHPFSVPSQVEAGPDAAWPGLWQAAVDDLWQAWSDDAVLGRVLTVPPGVKVPGAVALAHYITEYLVHGWDLATATGQPPEGPAAVARVAEGALGAARQFIPAEGRDAPLPFGPVQPASAGAGPVTQLAAWLGRVV